MGYYIYGKLETVEEEKKKIRTSTYIQRGLIIAIWIASIIDLVIYFVGVAMEVEYAKHVHISALLVFIVLIVTDIIINGE